MHRCIGGVNRWGFLQNLISLIEDIKFYPRTCIKTENPHNNLQVCWGSASGSQRKAKILEIAMSKYTD